MDELGLNFVRSLLSEAMQEGFIRFAERRGVRGVRELLAKGEVGRCLDRDIADLPEARQRAAGYAALGGESAGSALGKTTLRTRVLTLLVDCLGKVPSGRRTLRLYFEQSLRKRLTLPAAAKECVVRRLRRTVSPELISRDLVSWLAHRSGRSAELRRLGRQAGLACRHRID